MARRVFYSFHYMPDNWRAAQVRSIGAIEGNAPALDNDWETITKGGDKAIAEWIAGQLKGRSCTVVLVGENTAGRKWITHEIIESWKAGMGVVGVCIHGLKDKDGYTSRCGSNPFDYVTLGSQKLSSVVKLRSPAGTTSTAVYNSIKDNLSEWVEEAILIRRKY